MMKMNGLNIANYWIVNIVFDLILFLITSFVFFTFGVFILDVSFFTQTNGFLLFLIIFGWGLSQIGMAFFLQVFIQKARIATIIGYIIAVWVTLVAVGLNLTVYPIPEVIPSFLIIIPQFSFSRLIYLLSIYCTNTTCISKFDQISNEIQNCLIGLYFSGLIMIILGIYLNEIITQEFGVPKDPLFCLRKKKKIQQQGEDEIQLLLQNDQQNPNLGDLLQKEDIDCKQEREQVQKLNYMNFIQYPLVVKNLCKIYKAQPTKPAFMAVKSFNLIIKPGEVFGLLGPNGAGKTSLIAMLTGLYQADYGNAWIAGNDIKENIDQVHSLMGVCPQFDLLWPDLTVKEHLYFYARLRGVNVQQENQHVQKAIEEVYLQKFQDFQVKQLSGGMKRRLSVAIALVGSPKLVFLDEPTTGLDPENRRQLWDILVQCRSKRAMVLTTHQMEEADVLSTRIGIMTKGVLRCVGPQQRLKSLYGSGYHLYINCHKQKYLDDMKITNKNIKTLEFYHQQLEQFIKNLLPQSTKASSFGGNFIYLIPLQGLQVSIIFDELEKEKQNLMIADWGISQTNLEDVFMKIVDKDDI